MDFQQWVDSHQVYPNWNIQWTNGFDIKVSIPWHYNQHTAIHIQKQGLENFLLFLVAMHYHYKVVLGQNFNLVHHGTNFPFED